MQLVQLIIYSTVGKTYASEMWTLSDSNSFLHVCCAQNLDVFICICICLYVWFVFVFASVNLIWRQFLFAGLVCTTSVTNMKLLLPTNHLLKTDLLHRGFRRNQIIFFWWFSAITMIIIKILMVDASYIQKQIPLCVETKAHQHVFLCHNDQRRRNISKSTLLSFNSSLYFLAIISAFIILLF